MAKKGDSPPSQEKLERKLKKARLKLEVAQARLQQERKRGKQEIERARLQAAEWEAEAMELVEHRLHRLSEVEALVSPDSHNATSPEAAADAIASMQETI